MPNTESPLRYPGGKSKLYNLIQPIVQANVPKNGGMYIEPFAGGAGLALSLLYHNDVEQIVLNDLDVALYAFWSTCLNQTEEICARIEATSVNMDSWYEQREIYYNHWLHDQLDVGFATLFMNRCNVSGVLRGGPIGGKEQTGNFKLDARFNKTRLIEKIKKLGANRNRIQVFNRNATIFLEKDIQQYDEQNVILNIDPPYVKKGPLLYKNSFEEADHAELADIIHDLQHKWIVTYDECDLVREMYENYRTEVITLNYSVGHERTGKELMIFGNNTLLPQGYMIQI